ncbi:MAG: c-type cytochrome, partial [Candidatus Tectomicrobia bacterium]
HVDMASGRPVENPDAAFENNPQWILPANAGAHNWEPMSFDEDRGVMYFYYHDYPNFYSLDEAFVKTGQYKINAVGLSLGVGFGAYRQALEAKAQPSPGSAGYLIAFDPLSGESKWKQKLPSTFNGGVLGTTTGLLFHGGGTGIFSAYDVDDGSSLWQYQAYGSFSSSVISYGVDGEQYIATMVSGSLEYKTPGTLLVFKLDADMVRQEPPVRDRTIPEQPTLTASKATLNQGNSLYHEHCAICHRGLGVASIVATASPDLRRMTPATQSAFQAIVLGGSKKALGMPAFGGVLDVESAQAIQAFVSVEASKARKTQLEKQLTPQG